jgi:hypothetical protein
MGGEVRDMDAKDMKRRRLSLGLGKWSGIAMHTVRRHFGLSWTPHQACDRFGGFAVIHVDDII